MFSQLRSRMTLQSIVALFFVYKNSIRFSDSERRTKAILAALGWRPQKEDSFTNKSCSFTVVHIIKHGHLDSDSWFDVWQQIGSMNNVESTIVDIMFAKINYRTSKHSLCSAHLFVHECIIFYVFLQTNVVYCLFCSLDMQRHCWQLKYRHF